MLVGNWIVGSFGVDKNGEVFGVLDVDSDELDDFSEIDAEGLKEIVKIIEHLIN
jgi:GAF domain-containing protein